MRRSLFSLQNLQFTAARLTSSMCVPTFRVEVWNFRTRREARRKKTLFHSTSTHLHSLSGLTCAFSPWRGWNGCAKSRADSNYIAHSGSERGGKSCIFNEHKIVRQKFSLSTTNVKLSHFRHSLLLLMFTRSPLTCSTLWIISQFWISIFEGIHTVICAEWNVAIVLSISIPLRVSETMLSSQKHTTKVRRSPQKIF